MALFVVPGVAYAAAPQTSLRHDCSHVYSQPYYRVIAKPLITTEHRVDRRDLYRLAAMRYCARSAQAQAGMLRWTKHRLRWRRRTLEYVALTPYVCARGFRSAIPCWIVYRESGPPSESLASRWAAHNPQSAARGPYQLLGHGEPWPAVTWTQKMAHHRIAAWLWNGGVESNGLGPHHWACC